MGMKAGTKGDLAGSMAEDIEVAFRQAWTQFFDAELPDAGKQFLQMFFTAIAQGVVSHVQENMEVRTKALPHFHQGSTCSVAVEGGKAIYTSQPISLPNHYHEAHCDLSITSDSHAHKGEEEEIL